MNTVVRVMRNPQAFVGKVIRARWNIPDGYWRCAMTGKLFPENDLLNTFNGREVFSREFLIKNGIYVEEADWLSEEGYDEIMDVLYRLDLLDFYWETLWGSRR